jgi:hypothetical protein
MTCTLYSEVQGDASIAIKVLEAPCSVQIGYFNILHENSEPEYGNG